MKAKSEIVKLSQTVQALPEMVFEALTQAFELKQWMCQEAYVEPRKGGFIRLRWQSGYEAYGMFTSFSPPKSMSYSWQSSQEPGETEVKITLKPVDAGTKITLTHSGFGVGKKWAGRCQESEHGWTIGLANLKSLLETGLDLREAQQPRLGLGFEAAKDAPGLVVTDVIPDAPAHQAGLQKGDVMLSLAGKKLRSEQDFMGLYGKMRAGQKVKLVYLRDGKRRTATVELGQRPVRETPADLAAVVEQARQLHEQAMAVLRTNIAVLMEEQAAQPPAEGEWSVKQTLAHLVACEPGYRLWALETLLGHELPWVEARTPEQFAAVFATAPTVGALLDRYERELAESRAFVAALSPEHCVYKSRYRQITLGLLDFAFHTQMHLAQIQNTIKAIQG